MSEANEIELLGLLTQENQERAEFERLKAKVKRMYTGPRSEDACIVLVSPRRDWFFRFIDRILGRQNGMAVVPHEFLIYGGITYAHMQELQQALAEVDAREGEAP